LPAVLSNTSGFLYYVSVTGITGAATGGQDAVGDARQRIGRMSDLPVAVGFGIKTPEQAAKVAQVAEAVVVGSAIVDRIAQAAGDTGQLSEAGLKDVLSFVGSLADGVRGARRKGAA